MTERRAKVFWSGRSQAIRLPKDFRFDGNEVIIRREGNAVILEAPGAAKSFDEEWGWLKDLRPLDDDVVAAANEQPDWPPDNPDVAEFFK